MAKKLSDADVGRMRDAAGEGRSAGEIAAKFGCSTRHAERVIRGAARPQLGGLDADLATGGNVGLAVEHFLDGLADLDPAELLQADLARSLAATLDQGNKAATAGAANAAPALARQLLEIVAELRGSHREPDAIDEIRARRHARLLAQSAVPAELKPGRSWGGEQA